MSEVISAHHPRVNMILIGQRSRPRLSFYCVQILSQCGRLNWLKGKKKVNYS